jgi:hypothetical protein
LPLGVLEPFGGFAGVVDGRGLAGVQVGVVLHGVEAQRVPVGIEDLGEDPAQAGPVHAGVRLAEFVELAGELLDGGLVGHADGEVVESGRRAGPLWVEPQGEPRYAQEAFWTKAADDGLLPAGADLAWVIDTASILAAAETYLLVTRMLGWDLDTYQDWLAATSIRLLTGPGGPGHGPVLPG